MQLGELRQLCRCLHQPTQQLRAAVLQAAQADERADAIRCVSRQVNAAVQPIAEIDCQSLHQLCAGLSKSPQQPEFGVQQPLLLVRGQAA
jgi:hypothetical protein